MNFEKKRSLVRRVRMRMNEQYEGQNVHAVCHLWAAAVIDELWKLGRRAIIQAGTMQWPFTAHDDGVNPTHFSYMWEESETTRAMIEQGLMPEMHVWAALPDTQEIVDVTTCYLPHQAKVRAGLVWTAKQPPDYLWCTAKTLPAGAIYRPYGDAYLLTTVLLERSGIVLPVR